MDFIYGIFPDNFVGAFAGGQLLGSFGSQNACRTSPLRCAAAENIWINSCTNSQGLKSSGSSINWPASILETSSTVVNQMTQGRSRALHGIQVIRLLWFKFRQPK